MRHVTRNLECPLSGCATEILLELPQVEAGISVEHATGELLRIEMSGAGFPCIGDQIVHGRKPVDVAVDRMCREHVRHGKGSVYWHHQTGRSHTAAECDVHGLRAALPENLAILSDLLVQLVQISASLLGRFDQLA